MNHSLLCSIYAAIDVHILQETVIGCGAESHDRILSEFLDYFVASKAERSKKKFSCLLPESHRCHFAAFNDAISPSLRSLFIYRSISVLYPPQSQPTWMTTHPTTPDPRRSSDSGARGGRCTRWWLTEYDYPGDSSSACEIDCSDNGRLQEYELAE